MLQVHQGRTPEHHRELIVLTQKVEVEVVDADER